MKIAIVVGRFPSISQVFILNQIVGLLKLGHDVDIFTKTLGESSENHQEVDEFRLLEKTFILPKIPQDKIKFYTQGIYNLFRNSMVLDQSVLGQSSRLYVAALTGLYSNMSSINNKTYDVIHCHFGDNSLSAIALRNVNSPNAKIVTTFHGYDVNLRSKSQNVYTDIFREGDLFTVNSEFTSKRAIALGCPANKLCKLPVAVDLSKFQYRRNNFKHGEPVQILTVARLTEKKGLEYSIKAIAKVAASYPLIEYNIIGDGELRNPLTELIESLDCMDIIHLRGSRDHETVRSFMDQAHIFILASVTASNGDMEGQGLVLQEAQAIGVPVISTLHNGIPDGVLDGESGFLVPEKDVDALAAKLQHLISHPDLCSEMGENGRNFIEEKYDLDKLNQQLVSYYNS